jgi:hypothetical protein
MSNIFIVERNQWQQTVMFVRRKRNGRWQLECCCVRAESKYIYIEECSSKRVKCNYKLWSEINKNSRIIAVAHIFW